MERSNPDRLLAGLAGLADPTRLRLLHLLDRSELGVAELCDVLRLPQSTVSRHLKVLGDAGFVENRAEGTSRRYRRADLDAGAKRLWRAAREQAQGWAVLAQDGLRLDRLLASRRDEAERFFAGAAGEWERLRSELYGIGFLTDAALALLPGDWTVADLGCGTGDLAARLARQVRRVHAIDRSAAMLRAARRRVDDLPNVTLHQAALDDLPLADGSCDAALLLLVLTYAEDVDPVLAEAARVLRPGGRLVVVDLATHGDDGLRRRLGHVRAGFDPADLSAALARAGLRGDARVLPPAAGATGPALVLASTSPAAGARAAAGHAV
jgi:ArsR family transcriptional regulator